MEVGLQQKPASAAVEWQYFRLADKINSLLLTFTSVGEFILSVCRASLLVTRAGTSWRLYISPPDSCYTKTSLQWMAAQLVVEYCPLREALRIGLDFSTDIVFAPAVLSRSQVW